MRISIIGCGRIGFTLESDPLRYKPCTHAGAIETLINSGQSVQWDYLCDLDVEKTRRLETWIVQTAVKKIRPKLKIQTTHNYREVILSRPDILVIASDTNTHFEIAKTAIENDIPRIVVEKPVTLSYRQAMALFRLAQKRNTHIWVNYERRYHPKYIHLKNEIAPGSKMGAALHYRGWFASGNSALYKSGPDNEGALLHDTTHLADLAMYLFGDVVKQDSRKPSAHSHTLSLVHNGHTNQISGEILTTIHGGFFHFELQIFFENGRVTVGNGFIIYEKGERSKLYKNFTSLSSPTYTADKPVNLKSNPFLNLYKSVINDDYDASFLKDACQNIWYLT